MSTQATTPVTPEVALFCSMAQATTPVDPITLLFCSMVQNVKCSLEEIKSMLLDKTLSLSTRAVMCSAVLDSKIVDYTSKEEVKKISMEIFKEIARNRQAREEFLKQTSC